MRTKFTSIIMAGGGSSRMGADKALANIHGQQSIQYLADFLNVYTDEVIVSGNSDAYHMNGVKVVPDAETGRGPLEGLHTCLTEAAHEYTIVVSADMPLVDVATLENLKTSGKGCVYRRGEYLMPFPGYYPKAMADVAKQQLQSNERSMHAFIEKCSFEVLEAPNDDTRLMGFNTPEELGNIVSNTVRLQFYGKLTEVCAGDNHLMYLPEHRSISNVMVQVVDRFPEIGQLTTRQANNGKVLNNDQEVEPGILDIMPPFSGG